MKHRQDVTLEQLLDARTAGVALASSEPGDRALLAGRYEQAVAAYAARTNPSKAHRAKHGFALAMVGEGSAAIELLNRDNAGEHPEALAVLAWSLWYSHPPRFSAHPHKASCRELLEQAQAHPSPPALVFRVLLDLWFSVGMGGRPREAAERAAQLYPDTAFLVARVARERRVAGDTDAGTLAVLMEHIESSEVGILEEAFLAALALHDFDSLDRIARRVVERASASSDRDDQKFELTLMQSCIQLRMARAGGAEAARRGLEIIEPYATAAGSGDRASGQRRYDACRIAVCLAAEADDPIAIQQAVASLVNVAYDPEGESHLPDLCFLRLILEGYDEVFGVELDVPWMEYDARVLQHLDTAHRVYLGLLVACARVECGTDTEHDRASIVSEGPRWGPLSEITTMFQVIVDEEPIDVDALGTLLARAACSAEDGNPQLAERLGYRAESLGELETETLIAVFDAALDAMSEQRAGTGEGMLAAWGPLLAERAPDALRRLGAWITERTGKSPDLPKAPDPIQAYLAKLPGPDACPTEPSELTLLEAATLIALLRSEIDHARWTLAPLDTLGPPFEPESPEYRPRRFLPVLFDLLGKGVVGIAPATPPGVLVPKDGKVSAYLDRIVWMIWPQTLALHRAVRDLPRDQWPAAWIEQAPILGRDLGAQELVVYMTHLCIQRRLERPEVDVVEPQLRALLEQRSIAHGYYLVHKTVKETADYYTKYRPKPQAIVTRMHNLLKGNIEKSLAAGWDTVYNRENDLPVSLLFDALNSGLTKWGDAAFRHPVFELGDADGSAALESDSGQRG